MEKNILNIINEYNNSFFESLNNNIDTIINAFTAYYGEKYRNIITERIENTYFFTFLSNDIIDMMKTGYNKLDSSNKNLHNFFNSIIDYYQNKNKFSKVFEYNGALTGNFKKQVNESIKNAGNACAFQLVNIDMENNPIYTLFFGIGISDETIIHELNHVITNSVLAYIPGNKIELIEKIGTTTSLTMKQGEALEEVLNDKAAYDITNIFYKLGGQISKYHLYSMNIYPLLFPLIYDFYYKYYNLIKEARISDNQNILFTKIDKMEFKKYQEFITEEINNVYVNNQISPGAIKKANGLIKKLQK